MSAQELDGIESAGPKDSSKVAALDSSATINVQDGDANGSSELHSGSDQGRELSATLDTQTIATLTDASTQSATLQLESQGNGNDTQTTNDRVAESSGCSSQTAQIDTFAPKTPPRRKRPATPKTPTHQQASATQLLTPESLPRIKQESTDSIDRKRTAPDTTPSQVSTTRKRIRNAYQPTIQDAGIIAFFYRTALGRSGALTCQVAMRSVPYENLATELEKQVKAQRDAGRVKVEDKSQGQQHASPSQFICSHCGHHNSPLDTTQPTTAVEEKPCVLLGLPSMKFGHWRALTVENDPMTPAELSRRLVGQQTLPWMKNGSEGGPIGDPATPFAIGVYVMTLGCSKFDAHLTFDLIKNPNAETVLEQFDVPGRGRYNLSTVNPDFNRPAQFIPLCSYSTEFDHLGRLFHGRKWGPTLHGHFRYKTGSISAHDRDTLQNVSNADLMNLLDTCIESDPDVLTEQLTEEEEASKALVLLKRKFGQASQTDADALRALGLEIKDDARIGDALGAKRQLRRKRFEMIPLPDS